MAPPYRHRLAGVTGTLGPLLPPRLRERSRRMLFRWFHPTLALASGLRVRIASLDDWIVYEEILLEGVYDAAIRRALHGREPGARVQVVDLGANVGFFTLRLFDLADHEAPALALSCTLVEGHPQTMRALARSIHAHPSLAQRVRLVEGLVGRRSGTAVLATDRGHGRASILRSGATQARAEVPYVDLLAMFPRGSRIDLLKCDIEGAEQLFIENYADLLSTVRCAVFELHHSLCDTDACRARLHDLGFVNAEDSAHYAETSVLTVWR